ncbi:efflux RND transporter periplasmic adaptor subunit [Nonomuraea sp. NPDC050328]|uniref:efflux RND transporter periplasmic adaptor subunit n=1 Tax=Nonomuraea sp. NPDC050328 TaxID=3364361 RepID=UPI0037BC510B
MIRRRVLTAVLLAALAGCSAEEQPQIQVAEVGRGDVLEVVEAPATIGARATAALRSPAQGTLTKLYVQEGDRVRKGQILAKISSPQATEELKQARRAARPPRVPSVAAPAAIKVPSFGGHVSRHFAKARAEAGKIKDTRVRRQLLAAIRLAEAQHRAQTRALDRIMADLNRSIGGLVTQVSGGFATSMRSLQAASTAQARSAVKLAEQTVAGLTIKAPFSGVVTLGSSSGGSSGAPSALSSLLGQQLPAVPSSGGGGVPVATGVPVSAGDTIVTVTDISELTLAADIDETDVLLVKPGVRAEVELDAVQGATYTAQVQAVGVTPEQNTTGGVSYPVRLALGEGVFDDGSAAPVPKPGMSAVTQIPVREARGAVAVPASAIVTSGRDSVVWAVRDGRAERRVVKLGAQGDTLVEVISGLTAGERVVVKGADSVRQGQTLS